MRAKTEALSLPLTPEDCNLQSIPEASPAKWHLAHTTWFFETFVLADHIDNYKPYDDRFGYLFNSYYEAKGSRHPRPKRGMLSRPSLDEVYDYRHWVDVRVSELLEGIAHHRRAEEIANLVCLGLEHEEQHQELLLTDIQHAFFQSPLGPAYLKHPPARGSDAPKLGWMALDEGLRWVGHEGRGFAFDNETPRHRAYVASFEIATRLVTNREYLDFIEDGGYRRPELWVSDGWALASSHDWSAPLYWQRDRTGAYSTFSLAGWQPVDESAPVSHISWYEADAYARWAGARLPTESEWESLASTLPVEGNLLESGRLLPTVASSAKPAQLFGDTWEWTQSPYVPYPGFRPLAGALGEYNGKFMCNQMVLRGGSALTSRHHVRASYRNYFHPHSRWQMTGIRLARSL